MIPLGVAAGHLKRPDQLPALLRVPADILKYITLGSYTIAERDGNAGSVFWGHGGPALNALGLPNCGMQKAREFLLEAGELLRENGRIGRVSVAGFSADDYEKLALDVRFLYRCMYHLELNLGCPNVRNDGVQEPIISFQPELIDDILRRVWKVYDTTGLVIAVKLSPYSDPFLLKEVAAVLADHREHVGHVVTCNTFPNAWGCADDGTPLVGANDGFAGLSGEPMRLIALGQVRQLRDALPRKIAVVGVGGISTGQDVRYMELAGADWVQIGTAFFLYNDPRVFVRIAEEYAKLSELETA